MPDLSSLNREQLEAVLTTKGPLLVLAGAGSGKTRVITYRLAHLIGGGVPAKAILSVTFTNKAAHEMRERARDLVGPEVKGATISTFHALGVRILRSFGERVGLRPGFTISDAADQLGAVRRILRELKIDDRRFDAQRILSAISAAKNAGLSAERFRERDGVVKDAAPGLESGADALLKDDEYRLAAVESYARYEAALRAQNVADFDDLLLLTVRLCQESSEVLEELRARWRFLMIDEYQDTNGAQFELMRLLAGSEHNLCVVGDDDQSIYGWRGADVSNILHFRDHFPRAKIVKLETNYRSTGSILDVANAIIAKNPNRYDKVLRAAAGRGDPVRLVCVEDEDKEAEAVAGSILSLIAGGSKEREIAILFRSNVQSRNLELALRSAHVPYRVVGGLELFDKREVKDALAYVRALHNPEDEQSLRRVLNYPPRGIGESSVERIDDWAKKRDLTLQQGLERCHQAEAVAGKTADAIAAFLDLLSRHRKMLDSYKPSLVVKKLFEAIKLEDALLASSDSGSASARRVDNVREIVRQLERYEQKVESGVPLNATDEDEPANKLPTLDGFLRDLALTGFGDDKPKDEKKDQVTLSTIHAAKGLEWPHVFLVGVEEEILPHKRTVDGDGEIAEERRLAYVAVTRARRTLTVSYARNRARYGKIVPRQQSRFLDGLPEDAIEKREDNMTAVRTEAEKDAIAAEWKKKIRAQLGIES